MSFYRTFLVAFVAAVIASPVLAIDTISTSTTQTESTTVTQPAEQSAPQVTTKVTTVTTEVAIKTNINTATLKELIKVDGINAVRARAILNYRKKHGQFKSLDELRLIKSFKKLKEPQLKAIQDQLSV